MLSYSACAAHLLSDYYDELSESYISSNANKPRSCQDCSERTLSSPSWGGGTIAPLIACHAFPPFPNCHNGIPLTFQVGD